MKTVGIADGGRKPGTPRSLSARNGMRLLLLAGVIWTGAGCATATVVHEAKDRVEEDPCTRQTVTIRGKKAMYALTPVAVAWDAATAPILGLGLLWLWASDFNG